MVERDSQIEDTSSTYPEFGTAVVDQKLSDRFISTQDVLQGIPRNTVLEHELRFGNADLIRAIELAGIAGPFKVVSPWELEDTQGVRRIHAGGYSALPFGERYPPLLEFVNVYLADDRNMGLPQQSIIAWRAALEHNLVQLLAEVAPSHADSQVFFSNSGAEAIECAIKDDNSWSWEMLIHTAPKKLIDLARLALAK